MGVYWLAANHTKREYIQPHVSLKIQHQLSGHGQLGGMLIAALYWGDENGWTWRNDRIGLYSDLEESDEFGSYDVIENDYTDVSDRALALAEKIGFVQW